MSRAFDGVAVRAGARAAARHLRHVVAGPESAPAPADPNWRRTAARTALCLTTVALFGFSVMLSHLESWEFVLVLAAAQIAPLPLAVRYPLWGWRIGCLALLLTPLIPPRPLAPTGPSSGQHVIGLPWNPVELITLMVAFCVAGARYGRPVLLWTWALTLAVMGLSARWGIETIVMAAATTTAAIVIDGATARQRARRELSTQAELTELERARRAILEERARIARELHDVVAHHMSLLAIQTESAVYRLADLPQPAKDEFRAASRSARTALKEMRQLLDILRGDQPAERRPQPQIRDLPKLVEGARQAGVQVVLSMPDTKLDVPPAAAICAYRIVQESLSNAHRHAHGALVTIAVEHTKSAVRLNVTNTAADQGAHPDTGGQSYGLVGMRERVSLLGGSLSAGPTPEGGFSVSAVLPVDRST